MSTLKQLDFKVTAVAQLAAVRGLGDKTVAKIAEILESGTLAR